MELFRIFMLVIRSIIFNILFIGWTALLITFLWILLPFSKAIFRGGIKLWPIAIFPLMRSVVGITFEERGLENIPDKPVIFAVKHQSAWETMYFLWQNKHNCYIMKKELNKIPFWKIYMTKCGHIMVDRHGGISSMRQMISDTTHVLKENRSVVIFPEGTRTKPGHTSSYHPGIAALYSRTNAEIIPVALNSGIFWGRRQFIKKPGLITIEFLAPIQKGYSKQTFMRKLENRIELATRKLEGETLLK